MIFFCKNISSNQKFLMHSERFFNYAKMLEKLSKWWTLLFLRSLFTCVLQYKSLSYGEMKQLTYFIFFFKLVLITYITVTVLKKTSSESCPVGRFYRYP